MKEIIFAGGCFWGIEAYMSKHNGVIETRVGYANGMKPDPCYEDVCTGATGHAEACYIKYDESKITLEKLLNKFWNIIDPTILDRQGNDIGNQYRTGIYYTDPKDLELIIKTKNEQQEKYNEPIITEIEPLKIFHDAEEYHQKYLEKNPNGYCHIPLDKVK